MSRQLIDRYYAEVEKVIGLLQRVCTVNVGTMEVIGEMEEGDQNC